MNQEKALFLESPISVPLAPGQILILILSPFFVPAIPVLLFSVLFLLLFACTVQGFRKR